MDSPSLFLFGARRLLRPPPPRPRESSGRRRPLQNQPGPAFNNVYRDVQARLHAEAYEDVYPNPNVPYNNTFDHRHPLPYHMAVNRARITQPMDGQRILNQLFDAQPPHPPIGDQARYVRHLDNLLREHEEPTEREFTRRVLDVALSDYNLHLRPPFLDIRNAPTLARLCVGWITVHDGGEVVAALATELELARFDDYLDDPEQERQVQEAQARERDRVFGWADGDGQDQGLAEVAAAQNGVNTQGGLEDRISFIEDMLGGRNGGNTEVRVDSLEDRLADDGTLDRTLNDPTTTPERRARVESIRRRVLERRGGWQGGAREWEEEFGRGGRDRADAGPDMAASNGRLGPGRRETPLIINRVRMNLEPQARTQRTHGPDRLREHRVQAGPPRSRGPVEPGYWPAHGVRDHIGAAQQDLNRRLPGTGENVECAICMESLAGAAHLLAGTECGHAFHEECVKAWLRTAPVPACPACRREYILGPPRNFPHHHPPPPPQGRDTLQQLQWQL